MNWQIKAYSKQYSAIIKKLSALAKRKTPYEVSEIFFAPIESNLNGYYDCEQNIIVLSDKLLFENYTIIKQIFLHELAHLIQFHIQGLSYHDEDFKHICEELGVDAEFKKAKVDLEQKLKTASKIKKLIALSSSSEIAEAESALKKARQLMAQTNIEVNETPLIYEISVQTGKKLSSKITYLAQMAQLITSVFLIYSYTNEGDRTLLCFGSHEMLEVFTYLYDYFTYTVDFEYKKYIKTNNLKSSYSLSLNYYLGVYNSLIGRLKPEATDADSKALIKLEEDIKQLAISIRFSNSHLKKGRTNYSSNHDAYINGKECGKTLQINPGIKQNNTDKKLLLE